MLEQRRYPTPYEVEAIMARARRMRSVYMSALVMTAVLRAKQFLSRARERRIAGPRRFYPDVG